MTEDELKRIEAWAISTLSSYWVEKIFDLTSEIRALQVKRVILTEEEKQALRDIIKQGNE